MIYPHWMPLHRGNIGNRTDKSVFDEWKPDIIKIVWDGSTIPYLEDIPPNAKIIWRNYPLSEEFHGGLDITSRLKSQSVEIGGVEVIGGNGHPQNGSGRDALYVPKAATRAVSNLPTPEQAAEVYVRNAVEVASYCESRGVAKSRLLFEGPNEYPVWAHGYAGLARLEKARLRGLHAAGLRGVVVNLGVGWPGNTGPDTPPVWEWANDLVNEFADGDYLGVHEYWSLSGIAQNWRWWAGRMLQCPHRVPFLITECGIDVGVEGVANAKKGWLDLPGSMDDKVSRYINELWQYCDALKDDGRVKGAIVYTYDGNRSDWGQFDIRIEQFIVAFLQRVRATGLPKPGNIAMEQTLTEMLSSEFGNDFENIASSLPHHATKRYAKRPIAQIDRVVLHHTDTGTTTTWQAVARYHVASLDWPGIGYHIGVQTRGGREIVSLLNTPDTVSYHAHQVGNDYGLAVCLAGRFATTAPSAGEVETLRRVVAVLRRWATWKTLGVQGHRDVAGNDTACPGDALAALLPVISEPVTVDRAALLAAADAAQVMRLNPAAALQKRIFADGYVPTSPEFEINDDGVTYVAQRAEQLASGVVRVYYAQLGDWANVRHVTR